MTLLASSLVAGYALAAVAGSYVAGPYGTLAGVAVGWLGGGVLSLALVSLRYALLPRATVDAMIRRTEDGPMPGQRAAPADNASEFDRWDMDLEDERMGRDVAAEFETGRRTA